MILKDREMRLLCLALLIGIMLDCPLAYSECLPGPVEENVGRIKKIKAFEHPKKKCAIWVNQKITIIDVMTDQEVDAYISDSTRCFNRNGQIIDCSLLSPIWPVILLTEFKTGKGGIARPIALVAQQIDGAH
jgi:hypothetical protein